MSWTHAKGQRFLGRVRPSIAGWPVMWITKAASSSGAICTRSRSPGHRIDGTAAKRNAWLEDSWCLRRTFQPLELWEHNNALACCAALVEQEVPSGTYLCTYP